MAGGAAVSSPDPAAHDVAIVRRRVVETLLPPAGPAPISEKEAAALLAGLQPDGRWADVDYADQSRASWKPGSHVRRALQLAQAYRAQGHPLCGKAEIRDRIVLALRWWVANDLQCPNWWWNRIGVPEALGRAILLMGDEFPKDLLPGASKILRRADSDDMTGQNTLWVCTVRIVRGCIENSPETVAAGFRRAADEVKIATGEGVQPDFSFHQHGPQLYCGGYGRGYAVYAPHLARLAAGTQFALGPEKVDILSAYLLDGEQWMIRGDRFDPSAIGREITRKGHTAAPLAQACADLLALGAPRGAELAAFARRLRGQEGAAPLAGNRHFWRSDFMVHQRPDWYASVRMFSKRTICSELVNGEGKKSHHLADGMTLIMRTGREFDAMPPVWDWKRLPGTTCEQGEFPGRVNQKGETSFVGGVSDGVYGVAAMDLKRGPLTAKKAWFMFDRQMVALGAGITCKSESAVFTSIDQRPLAGEASTSDGKAALARGRHALGAAKWVAHDGFAYALMDAAGAQVASETQTGSWHDISDPSSPDKVSHDVFSLWIDHGKKPAGASYAYRVVAPEAAGARPDLTRLPVAVENTPDLQATLDMTEGVAGIVFWKPGPWSATDSLVVTARQPCVVLVRGFPGGGLRLAVANPENQPLEATLELDRPYEGDGCTWSAETNRSTVKFDLPGGPEAGKSVVRELRPRKP
jgi:chondroitin AC lyase